MGGGGFRCTLVSRNPRSIAADVPCLEYDMIKHLLLAMITAVCVANALYAPAWNYLFAMQGLWYPGQWLPLSWVMPLTSVVLGIGYFLVTGIPAALYERIMSLKQTSFVSRMIWLATALAASIPLLQS
jgi:hypothetical protein